MKADRIDLGLALLSVLRIPGVPLGLGDIAAWCDSKARIWQIEKAALRKVRARLVAENFAEPGFGDRVFSRSLCNN